MRAIYNIRVMMMMMMIIIIIIIIIIIKSGNLEAREQNICIYKDTIYITMRDVKVMIIIKST
jgi:hypothetical protein